MEGKSFDKVLFINGYASDAPRFEIECLGINVSTGKKWGAEEGVEYYVIKLGKLIKKMKEIYNEYDGL